MAEEKQRCAWCLGDPLLRQYHDAEWGIKQLHDDRKQFEFLTLETMQCGLSWLTVLRKRAAMDAAFDHFEPERIALYDETKLEALLRMPGIIHSPGKLRGMIGNARAFLAIQREFGSFDAWFWAFTGGRTLLCPGPMRTKTPLSERMSAELKKRGFRYLGPVVLYSHMQAAGMVNDHEEGCFGYRSLGGVPAGAEEEGAGGDEI